MAISRPVLLSLLGAVLIAAALMATRAMQAGVEPEPPLAPAPAKSAAKPGTSAKAAKSSAAAEPAAKAGSTAAGKSAAAAKPAPVAARPAADTPPLPVVRQLAAGRSVVILFRQPGASDDAAVRAAAESLRGTHAKVFSEPLSRLTRYRPLVGNLRIAQAPATIVVGRDLEATLVEGYVDAGSLRQLVADSRR